MNNDKLMEVFIPIDDENLSQNENLISAVEFDVKTKSPEEKTYIILYHLNDDDLEDYQTRVFSICIGRTFAYSDIKEKLISGLNIDIHQSKIITETKQTETRTGDKKYYLLPYEDCISVYAFCISVKDYYSDDSFNIEEYNNTDITNEDYIESRPGFITPEQEEYRKMLNQSLNRNKFINEMRKETNSSNI